MTQRYHYGLHLFLALKASLMQRGSDSFWPCSDFQEQPGQDTDTRSEINNRCQAVQHICGKFWTKSQLKKPHTYTCVCRLKKSTCLSPGDVGDRGA